MENNSLQYLENQIRFYVSNDDVLFKIFEKAKEIQIKQIKKAFYFLEGKVWELDNENFTVPNKLLESIEQAKEMLLQENECIDNMNFHECSECNIRCNCSTDKCSCSCRTEM